MPIPFFKTEIYTFIMMNCTYFCNVKDCQSKFKDLYSNKDKGGGMLFFGEISFFRAISLINVLGIFRDTQTNIQHLRLGVQIYEITFEDRIYTFRVL